MFPYCAELGFAVFPTVDRALGGAYFADDSVRERDYDTGGGEIEVKESLVSALPKTR